MNHFFSVARGGAAAPFVLQMISIIIENKFFPPIHHWVFRYATDPTNSWRSLERRVLDKIGPILRKLDKYVFAPDMGTHTGHVDYMSGLAPDNVACLSAENDGSGDPSRITARGVYEGMLESVKHQLGKENLDGLTILIQGTGKVGGYLIDYITRENPQARLILTDEVAQRAREKVDSLTTGGISADYAPSKESYDQSFDVFSPNAVGQVLNPLTVERMLSANRGKKLVIVGGANNQIDDRKENTRKAVEALFQDNGVLYAPDFVVNLGGILNLIYEFPSVMQNFGGKYDGKVPLERVKGVRQLLNQIFEISEQRRGFSTQTLAERLAEEHIARYAILSGHDARGLLQRDYIHS